MYSDENVKQMYTSETLWLFGQIRRGLGYYKEGKFHAHPSSYIQLAAVQLGYFLEHGAISYDAGEKKFSINYKRMPVVVRKLLKEVGLLYMIHDRDIVKAYFEKYTKGEGLKTLHMDVIDEAIGSIPVTLFNYMVTGLE